MFRLLLVTALCFPCPLAGQGAWTLTAERGWTTYSGAAHDTSAEPVHLRAWHPAVYSLRLAREYDRFGFGIAAGIALGQWGVTIGDFVVLPDESLRLIEIAPELSFKVATNPTGVVIRIHAGPILDYWTPSGEETRQRIGAQAGASLSVPMAARWTATLRTDVAFSRSLMNDEEETAAISRDPVMRRGRLALGITRRL